ncbi:MAG TPA: hypothetical protein RMH99_27220 [Sandaracinaceae bacterium LLY-WYZ-13_1]|nr:hypothetical protein [Sandaracinaceae bacterium LLY-WYZ-13_1]
MLDPAQIAPESARGLRRVECERMVSLGMFEGERVELLYGTIVTMTLTGPRTTRPSTPCRSASPARSGSAPGRVCGRRSRPRMRRSRSRISRWFRPGALD